MTERNPYHMPAGTSEGGQFTTAQLDTIADAARIGANIPMTFDEWVIDNFSKKELERIKNNKNLEELLKDQYRNYYKNYSVLSENIIESVNKKLIKNKTGTIQDLKELLNDPNDFYNFIADRVGEDYKGSVGLRGLGENEKFGMLKNSHQWEDGNITNKLLNGSATISISADWFYDPKSVILDNIKDNSKNIFNYGYGNVGLVIGDYGEGGEDIGELIIPNAKVIYMWKK